VTPSHFFFPNIKEATIWHRQEALALAQIYLNAIFQPRSLALINATEKSASVYRTVLRNLLDQSSEATISPVNPSCNNVSGIRCDPTVGY
jgi:hypothetical protein